MDPMQTQIHVLRTVERTDRPRRCSPDCGRGRCGRCGRKILPWLWRRQTGCLERATMTAADALEAARAAGVRVIADGANLFLDAEVGAARGGA